MVRGTLEPVAQQLLRGILRDHFDEGLLLAPLGKMEVYPAGPGRPGVYAALWPALLARGPPLEWLGPLFIELWDVAGSAGFTVLGCPEAREPLFQDIGLVDLARDQDERRDPVDRVRVVLLDDV